MVCDKILDNSSEEVTSPNLQFIECDVSDKTSFEMAFKTTEQKLGKVEVLVNNAGILRENNYEGMVDFIEQMKLLG